MAQPAARGAGRGRSDDFRLSWAPQPPATQPAPQPEAVGPATGYRGVSAFFNVREAYSNVRQGQWEVEFSFKWVTRSDEEDEFEMAQSLKYGLTDRFHIELEVEEPELGDGGDHGAGELMLTLYYQFTEQDRWLPAIGGFARGRFPTGGGSSGVDGTFGTTLTWGLTERLRTHLHGFVMTANGHIGEAEFDRRDFQWGVGAGIDWKPTGGTLLGMSYLNRTSDEDGAPNENLLELLLVQEIGRFGGAEHELKLGVDIGLDGHETTRNFGAKLQWAIEWP